MVPEDPLGGLEGLLRDLESLKENRLPNIQRLTQELESRIEEFQNLLDHKRRNNDSRKKLSDGKIEVEGINYEINEDFRQQTIQVSDEIDLDEVEAAKLFLLSQPDAEEWDRSPIVSAIMHFHKRRQFLLECLRLIFQYAYDQDDFPDPNEDDEEALEQHHQRAFVLDIVRKFTRLVLKQDDIGDNPSHFWSKCFSTMRDLESGIQRVADRTQRASVVGQVLTKDEEQIHAFERDTLYTQHESLSVISTVLLRQGFTKTDNFRDLITRARTLDKHDVVMLHYLPILMASAAVIPNENSGFSSTEIETLHKNIISYPETGPWTLRTLYNAFQSWWIVEYKGRFPDAPDVDSGASTESQALNKALREGGLQFMLSIAQDVRKSDWIDPAKVGLTNFLLREATTLPPESPSISVYFQLRLMDEFQSFVEAFISNMPDTLRMLKFEEDDQRKLLRSRFQKNITEYQYDLDTFLVLIAYAFQDSPESAKSFWSQQESNLFGFLQWAAKRQTTPRVAAFCEMLRSLSEGKECADNAHRFLLSEGAPVAGKVRRTASLSWNQIFAELEVYASSIKDRPATVAGPGNEQQMDQIVEPESYVMLECYLRLIAHLCYGSLEARTWLWSNENPSIISILFQLCSTNIESRIRACAFSALAALLIDKTAEQADSMWVYLDGWLSGGLSFTSSLRLPGTGSTQTEKVVLEMIFNGGFEEPNAFMQLLNALIVPLSQDNETEYDELPFPENLGSSYRLPGIDSYIDFALGKVFAHKTTQISDERQLALLRLNCLDFICTCLSSFNEDLVIIANRSNLPVEKILKSKSLVSYVKLHPFARVMEWLFDEKCVDALFAAAHQDVERINQLDSSSPLVASSVRALEVMNFIMRFQSTYQEIVKPIIKQSGAQPKITSHATVTSFEDGVLQHLNILVDIGLYCGLGHSELTLCSLRLLESLSSSRRLNTTPSFKLNRRNDRNKLIAALEKDDEAHRISHTLAIMMAWDPREFEMDVLASGYAVKSGILSFLKNCLEAVSDRPSIAHLLLGFTCNGNALTVDDNGIFGTGKSLFHSVARLALEYPDFLDETFISWASNIKEACIEVIRLLCQSSLSSGLVMDELRLSDYVFWQSVGLNLVTPTTLWDGVVAFQPEFLVQDSAVAFRNFLRQRTAYYDYISRELQHAHQNGISSLVLRLQSVLLGSTSFPGEPAIPNPNVFELLDFMEVGFSTELAMPKMEHFKELDFAVCKSETVGPGQLYDISRAQEVIFVRRREFLSGRLPFIGGSKALVAAGIRTEDKDLKEFDTEAQSCILVLVSRNHWRDLALGQFDALKSWIRLLVLALGVCDFSAEVRDDFIQQAYQLVLPKFEKARNSDLDIAIEFAELLNQLMISSSEDQGADGSGSKVISLDGGNDITFRAFQSGLSALTSNTSSLALRQPCYQLCSRFLRRLVHDSSKSTIKRRGVLRNVKLSGDGLVDILCDDITTGDAKTRIFALLMLEALVALSAAEDPKLILDPLDRLNFIGIMADSVKQIPHDLRQVSAAETQMVLSYHNACLAFLLRVAQTRHGALQLLNAGFFGAVKDSEIFDTDPDVGFDIESPEALSKFFDLMLSVLRIINSIVLKYQTDQTKQIGQEFLTAYRPSVVGILKRFAGIGGAEFNETIDLSDLVDNLTLLISATGYLEIEEQGIMKKRNGLEMFS